MRSFSLDDYRQRAPLRVGCLSQCFSAECTTEGVTEQVLLKQLLPALAREPAVAAAWLSIAEENTALQHSGCARVLDFGTSEGESFVVLELLHGSSLRELVVGAQQSDVWPAEGAIVAIAQAALEALSHGFDVGLAHLDLDPRAVIVRRDGTVTLTEFGMWRALPLATATRERFDKGRVAYLSPELVKSLPGDARSDVFSLGVILYELLARSRPFVGPTQLVTAMMIAEGKRKPLRELVPQATEVLCDIVETMLAVSPDERFQSPKAALGALVSTCVAEPHGVIEWVERLGLRGGPQSGLRHGASSGGHASSESAGLPPASAPAKRHALETVSLPTRAPTPASAAPALAPQVVSDGPPLAPPPLVAPAHLRLADPTFASPEAADDWVAPPPLLAPESSPVPSKSRDGEPVQVRDGKTAFLSRGEVLPASEVLRAEATDMNEVRHGGRRWASFPDAPSAASPATLRASASSTSGLVAGLGANPPGSGRPELVKALHGSPAEEASRASFAPLAPSPVSFQDYTPPPVARADPIQLRELPAEMGSSADPRWHEPSKTVFQMKGFAKAATRRGDANTPLYLVVLLAIAFGFAIVAGGVLLWRLFA